MDSKRYFDMSSPTYVNGAHRFYICTFLGSTESKVICVRLHPLCFFWISICILLSSPSTYSV